MNLLLEYRGIIVTRFLIPFAKCRVGNAVAEEGDGAGGNGLSHNMILL